MPIFSDVTNAAISPEGAAAAIALIAAPLAYAGARAGGKGAHLGPLDAARQEHKRDAYAELLHQADAYARSTEWGESFNEVLRQLEAADPGHLPPDNQIQRRVWAYRIELDRVPMERAVSLVRLVGPSDIAKRAEELGKAANALRACMIRSASAPPLVTIHEQGPHYREAHIRLTSEINLFVTKAQAHLNGQRPTRNWWWRRSSTS